MRLSGRSSVCFLLVFAATLANAGQVGPNDFRITNMGTDGLTARQMNGRTLTSGVLVGTPGTAWQPVGK